MWRAAALLLALLANADEGLPFQAEIVAARDDAEIACKAVLSCRGISWEVSGRESVVLTVTIDGEYDQDLVVFDPEHTYEFLAGPLSQGKHALRIEVNRAKSPAPDAEVRVRKFSAEGPADQPWLAYVPMLYGRPGGRNGAPLNAYSDVPLVLYVTQEKRGDGVEYEYTMIWSDEDGGMGTYPPLLMAKYGRTTDIDWVYRVRLDGKGNLLEEAYQTLDDKSAPFRGRKIGKHPVMLVKSDNNCMVEVAEGHEPKGNVRFLLTPYVWDRVGARERVMDAFPWTYRIANQEMQRERGPLGPKMEFPGDPHTATVTDARDYLLVEAQVEAPKGVTWRVRARAGDEWFVADHGLQMALWRGSFTARVAVKLPAGLPSDGVSELSLEAHGLAEGDTARVLSVSSFRLDDGFAPRSVGFALTDPASLTRASSTLTLERR